jgi:type II secretory pathway component GspD/PulD (secretin)
VTAPPDTQAQLKALLDQLRETRAIQATIETRFITLDLETLAPALRDKFRQSFGKPGAPKAVFLDENDTAAILAATQKQRESTILTAPRVTLFNGQRAYVQVATERAYVSGFTIVKNEKGETRYEPYASTVSSGVLLDVQATASADRKFVTVTLKPKLTRLEGLTPIPWDAAPAGVKNLFVQVPIVLTQELQTTVSVPDGGTLLLGGFVENASGLPQTRPATQPATRPVMDLYMLVKPTMIVQREQESKPFPLLSTSRPAK